MELELTQQNGAEESANMTEAIDLDVIHPELSDVLPKYDLIKDCLKGEITVKDMREIYLPRPADADEDRYASYIKRANFTDYTQKTLDALLGHTFVRHPSVTLPEIMKPMEEDANGKGLTLIQVAKELLGYVIAFGRAAIQVDYNPTKMGRTLSIADIQQQPLPTLKVIPPTGIQNWLGDPDVHTVVIKEKHEHTPQSSMEIEYIDQYRVWYRDPATGRVSMRLYRDGEDTAILAQEIPILTGASGKPLTRIPIFVIGSENNDFHTIDAPPLYGLASLNIAHYRNSADYEESVFIAGQPTYFVTGVTPEWEQEHLNDSQLDIGSRSLISLPQGASAGVLQAASNNLPFEAMKQKERQMRSMGAQLLEELSTSAKTATEVAIEALTRSSSLASAAENTATAIQQALRFATRYIGANPEEVNFRLELSTGLMSMTSQQQQSILNFVNGGVMTITEARRLIHRDGWIEEVENEELGEEQKLQDEIDKEEAMADEDGNDEITEDEGAEGNDGSEPTNDEGTEQEAVPENETVQAPQE